MRIQQSKSSRTQTLFFAALLVFTALCGCAMAPQMQDTADPPASPSGKALQASAQILFCDAPGTSCSPATSFSIAKLRDLNIVVNWSKLPAGNHVETLAVVHNPAGLYQSFHKGFMALSDNDSFSTSSALPVAGTFIARRSLTGTWTVQASLDGRVVGTQTVTLTP